MAEQRAVFAGAGPLIVLARAESLHLLRGLFRIAWVTPVVRTEVLPRDELPGKRAILAAFAEGWLREDTTSPAEIPGLRDHVDDGEASTIEAALASRAALIVLDDRVARIQAVNLGLRVTGTIGVQLLAKRAGLIPQIADAIHSMIDAGMYVSPALVTAALERAGESADRIESIGATTKTKRKRRRGAEK